MESKLENDKYQLLRWFRENGGYISNAIELLHSPEQGYHYVAETRAISVDEVVCTCPFGLTLSQLNLMPTAPVGIREYARDSVCFRLLGKVEERSVAAFFLAEQRLKGTQSFWFPYIHLLPTESELTTPLWFNDQELIYIKGTNLFPNDVPHEQTSIGILEAKFRTQWQLGIKVFKDANESVEQFTWELFLWAITIITSRSFTSQMFTTSSSDSFPILYPVIDIFNHRLGAKVQWQLKDGTFSLSLGARVEHRQQIFNNYAPKENEEFLMGYGFCIPNNPYERVALRLGEVSSEVHSRLRESVPSHWQSEIWDPKESVFYIRGRSHATSGYSNAYVVPELDCLRGIPPALAQSICSILLAHNEDSVLSEGTEAELWIWARTLDALLQRLESNLTAITQWNSRLPPSPPTVGARAASVYRTGQMTILQEVISELKAFLDPLRDGGIDIKSAFRK